MIHVKSLEVLEGTKLFVRFSDGTEGIADMGEWVTSDPFKPLAERAAFEQAFVDSGAVEWPCGVGIATEALYALAHDLNHPATLEAAQHNELVVSLRELRRLASKTQIETAAAMGIDQGQLSRLERQDDAKLSTLRAYVEALGGKLVVVAEINGKRMQLAV